MHKNMLGQLKLHESIVCANCKDSQYCITDMLCQEQRNCMKQIQRMPEKVIAEYARRLNAARLKEEYAYQ